MAFASKVRTSSICLKRGTIPAAEGASGGSSDTRVPSGPRYWRYSISKVAATLMNSLAWSSTGAGHDNRWAFPVRCALRQGPGPAPQEKGARLAPRPRVPSGRCAQRVAETTLAAALSPGAGSWVAAEAAAATVNAGGIIRPEVSTTTWKRASAPSASAASAVQVAANRCSAVSSQAQPAGAWTEVREAWVPAASSTTTSPAADGPALDTWTACSTVAFLLKVAGPVMATARSAEAWTAMLAPSLSFAASGSSVCDVAAAVSRTRPPAWAACAVACTANTAPSSSARASAVQAATVSPPSTTGASQVQPAGAWMARSA